jgi:hypothetical protein
MDITEKQIRELLAPLPVWAVKKHPTKPTMSAIHPMAIIDRINEVFGYGQWSFTTDFISCEEKTQVTKRGTAEESTRQIYVSAVKGRLQIGEMVIEQYGGSTNDDKGDALKGGATDALTKIASYLGIAASVYKNQGNVDGYGHEDAEAPQDLPTIRR